MKLLKKLKKWWDECLLNHPFRKLMEQEYKRREREREYWG